MKVAILDDYQNVSLILGKFEKLNKNFIFHVFNKSFENEDDLIDKLKDFEVLLVMRERTPITKNIINVHCVLKIYCTIYTHCSILAYLKNIFNFLMGLITRVLWLFLYSYFIL